MISKIFVVVALAASATAGLLAPTPLAAPIALAKTEVYSNPQYLFEYGVEDTLTGDIKNHQEQRSGDLVQGSYSLIDADGFRRIVEYTADSINGFNAIVRREPIKETRISLQQPLVYKHPQVTPLPAYVQPTPIPYSISKLPVATISKPTPLYTQIAKIGTYAPTAPILKVETPQLSPAIIKVSTPLVKEPEPFRSIHPIAKIGQINSLHFGAPSQYGFSHTVVH